MKTKETGGMALVTLAVTIVILLILAGVSVRLVIGNNNLFDKAKSTQKVQTATPSYIISTSPFSLSFNKNLYWALIIMYAFLLSIFSVELKS